MPNGRRRRDACCMPTPPATLFPMLAPHGIPTDLDWHSNPTATSDGGQFQTLMPMGKYSQHLTYSLLATLAGLPVGCFMAGLLIGGYCLTTETGDLGRFPNAFGFGLSVALFALFIGLIPALLYGVPAYALLSKRNLANVLAALGVGTLPGLALLPAEPSLAAIFLLFGACVSLATHLFARNRLAKLRAMDANNFKPNPLRESA
jgi:uncharacterized membrane protein